jgi:hypothetical protein
VYQLGPVVVDQSLQRRPLKANGHGSGNRSNRSSAGRRDDSSHISATRVPATLAPASLRHAGTDVREDEGDYGDGCSRKNLRRDRMRGDGLDLVAAADEISDPLEREGASEIREEGESHQEATVCGEQAFW